MKLDTLILLNCNTHLALAVLLQFMLDLTILSNINKIIIKDTKNIMVAQINNIRIFIYSFFLLYKDIS
ncbi:MAG: hypothetical protein DRP03_02100 [Candidatus Aenigmatarchaeota archaeon]|nr:MAG: hypothetical protein DRP03_02100 [Candidatus Aenigmarchaeota archaeon]